MSLLGHSSFREVKPGTQSGKAGAGKRSRDDATATDAKRSLARTKQAAVKDATSTEDDLPEIERTLRAFDLASKYGPCAGITRLERWERAEKFGLKPPAEIRDLLKRLEPLHASHQNIWAGRI